MKRAKRHQLKENELANTIAAAREGLIARKEQLTSILAAAREGLSLERNS